MVPDFPHHVTQRGNERRDIFFSPADRRTGTPVQQPAFGKNTEITPDGSLGTLPFWTVDER